ncbi:DMT family transporter [Pseudonocardia sp. TRM90224]|uniref:DMT family transporter n=1 Tax=Pseudonocardia sp. TRM90224 TaxID=2812678 RepID=UPI001E500F62|nr:EamA family transporter [Pseudonocardia sp. TRM90224]
MSVSSLSARPVSGVSFLVLAGLLWGTGGLLGRMLGEQSGMSSIAVSTYRLAVGGSLICLFLLVTGRSVPRTASAWRRVVVIGALAALFQGCYFAAVSMTSVSIATLVTIGTGPVAVLVVERLTGRGRAGLRPVLAVALALVGLVLLVGVPGAGGGDVLAGAALAVLSGCGFAAMTLVSARPVADLDAPTCTGLAFLLGGVLLAPLALLGSPNGLSFIPDATSLLLLALFGIVPTALAYSLYFRGLGSASAGVGVLMSLIEPLTAAVLAALLLGDRLGVTGVAGAVLLGAAVLLGGWSQRAERERSS